MTSVRPGPREPRGEYGIDGGLGAIAALAAMGAGGLELLARALTYAGGGSLAPAALELLGGLLLLQVVASYLYSTRRGKFVAWARWLTGLHLRGDERVLDTGCGRGAVLGIVAGLVPTGRAIGLDLWRSADQTGNTVEATRRNLRVEGVSDRCDLATGDMMAMPFPDATFDLVVSSLAIHNISGADQRLVAVDEAVRVLKPGGFLLIADLMRVGAYTEHLRASGMEEVMEHRPGWRFWFGVLGLATGLVTATKTGGGAPPAARR